MTKHTSLSDKIEKFINGLDDTSFENFVNGDYLDKLRTVMYGDNDGDNHYVSVTQDESDDDKYTILVTSFYNSTPVSRRMFIVTSYGDITATVKEYNIEFIPQKTRPCSKLARELNDRDDELIRIAIDAEKSLHTLDEKVCDLADKGDASAIKELCQLLTIEVVNTVGDLTIENLWLVPYIDNAFIVDHSVKATYDVHTKRLNVYDMVTGNRLRKEIELSQTTIDVIGNYAEEEHNMAVVH